jgi:hypothetical protein
VGRHKIHGSWVERLKNVTNNWTHVHDSVSSKAAYSFVRAVNRGEKNLPMEYKWEAKQDGPKVYMRRVSW